MLQIVTKMYFRPEVPLHTTVHRAVLYTNLTRLRADEVGLPVGDLAWSNATNQVSTATLSVTEHLEAELPDGTSSGHVATGGTQLLDELADVLAFRLDAAFSRDGDLVRRLVSNSLDASSRPAGRRLFLSTFEPQRFVTDPELDELRRFITQLLSLKRLYFERAMRAISRVVRATQHAADDPTIAYVDLVAALESLSDDTYAPLASWQQFEGRKRRLVDDALDGADPMLAERVRRAVIEAERLGAGSKFIAFVNENVTPDYYRSGATDSLRPMRGADFQQALKHAYRIRSRSVHGLASLPLEAWALGDAADTVSIHDIGIAFSLEGLARLARHVIGNYVHRAPAGVDGSFEWRGSLPGVLRMRAAPQYWIWKAEQFDRTSADRYFSGLASHLVGTLAGPEPQLPDMSAVLERIERLLAGTASGPTKTFMVAIFALWHRIAAPEFHRANSERVLTDYATLLERPEMASFVVGLLCGAIPSWTPEEWHALAAERRAQRTKPSHLELPPALDAALHVVAAENLRAAGRIDDARSAAITAVEEFPGNEQLTAWEAAFDAGEEYELELDALIPGLGEESSSDDEVEESEVP